MLDEVLVDILEGALELLLGCDHLAGVRQEEAGHVTEAGAQVGPTTKDRYKSKSHCR